jgi:hypothetical protein
MCGENEPPIRVYWFTNNGDTGSWSLLDIVVVALAVIVAGIASLIGKCNGAIK